MTINESIEHPGALEERRTDLAEGYDSGIGGGSMPSDARSADLEIIIPTLNEEARIGTVLQALVEYLGCQSWRSSVVIVDNGCTDRTLEVADLVSCADVSVRVIGCRDRGKGAAVRRGVLAASARYVGFCDADLSTPAHTIGPVMRLMKSGHQVVIGSRRCDGAEYVDVQPMRRRVGGAFFRSVARSVAPSITDTQCGFKFFHTHIAKALFSRATAEGFAFDAEIVGLALAAGITVTEVPVTWTDSGGSSFRLLSDGYGAMRELLAVRARVGETAPGVRELLRERDAARL
jgi:dolichyl-phosphate beta-glucosyltransferase